MPKVDLRDLDLNGEKQTHARDSKKESKQPKLTDKTKKKPKK
jgi:hypothetical protein